MTRSRWRGFLAVALAAPVFAQPIATPAPTPPTTTDLAEFTARAVTRLALLDARALDTPAPRDFAIAYELLGIAQDLAPTDPDIVRRRIEAAWNAGDEAAVLVMTRRLLELDPADTVAQLRLITSRIGRLQQVEERVAAYDRFLGPAGEKLDPSVRSRLALDAALLLRERGDERGFLERLKMAAGLDGTNKDAALLVLNFFNERADDPAGRLELLANLLYADPLDHRTHRAIRNQLADAGAFKQALRFHKSGRAITAAAGQPQDTETEISGYLLDWMIEGPEPVMKRIQLTLDSERSRIAAQAAMDPEKVESPAVMRPEDVRLDIAFENIRVLTALVQQPAHRDVLQNAMDDLAKTVAARIALLGDAATRPTTMTIAQAGEEARTARLELWLMRMLAGDESSEMAADIDATVADLPEDDYRRTVIAAWRALAQREWDAAVAAATTGRTNVWHDIAHARALLGKGDQAGAAAVYRAGARRQTLGVMNTYALVLASLIENDEASDKLAAQLGDYAATIPKWIDQMPTAPRQTQSLRVDLSDNAPDALEKVTATVRLRNLAPIPLGLGSARTMNSRLFFGPSLETGMRTRSDIAAGEVFEIDHRLRLMAGEELTVRCWPEVGLIGWLAEVGADTPSRLRWRIIQGFESRSNGERAAAPGCVETSTSACSRGALPEARLTIANLLLRFADPTDDETPALLVASRSKLMGGVPGGTPHPDAAEFGEKLALLYPRWNPRVRMLALAVLPPAAVTPALTAFDEEARKETDPMVLPLVIVTRGTAADQPFLAAAAAEARTAKIATLHGERLAAGVRTYATGGVAATPTPPPAGATR